MDTYQQMRRVISQSGFTVLGAFHPAAADDAPQDTGTLVLVGNAGPAMWERFSAERDPAQCEMDEWTRATISKMAMSLNAKAVFPFDAPFQPFQRWARSSGAGFISPLGLNIHPEFGLWHAFRAALCFIDKIDFPNPATEQSPCDTCTGKPCLTTCPVSAFNGEIYDTIACSTHLASAAGTTCMQKGCLARLACPVGQEYYYPPDQIQFHMRHFRNARMAAQNPSKESAND